MTQPSPTAKRIMAMRAAYDSVDEINDVVQAFRSRGDLAQALRALDERWPELCMVPWRRTPPAPREGE